VAVAPGTGPAVEDGEALRSATSRLAFSRPGTFRAAPLAGGLAVVTDPRLVGGLLAEAVGEAARVSSRPQAEVATDVADALAELGRVDPAFRAGVEEIVEWVVPIESETMFSTSHSSLPGVVFVRTRRGSPLWNAELLLHEAAHNWLFLVMRLDELVLATGNLYRSPWRSDRRPLRGILFGAHAFLLVADYMVAKWERGDEPARPLAQRAILEHHRARLGIRKLSRAGRWTPAGEALLEALRAHEDEAARRLRELKHASPVWRGAEEAFEWPCVIEP
jgi:HEXXH motif-containing protein